jgi:predicted TIM-barrel fold metal-dependent hydrolase
MAEVTNSHDPNSGASRGPAPRVTPPPKFPPRKPRLALPAGSVDSHLHMFGPADKYPFAADAQYISGDATDEMYFRAQDILGLSRAVLVSGGAYGQTFDHLLDMLRRNPHRLRGVVRLPVSATREDIAQLHAAGVRAARFFGPGRLAAMTPELLEMIDEVGWHVQFYPDPDSLLQVADRLLALNRVVVLDHFAHNNAMDGIDSPANRKLLHMLDTGRVWVKMSAPMRITPQALPYPAVAAVARALVRHAPERLVWGTDWPHTLMWDKPMADDGDLVDLLADWMPDSPTLERILVTNPEALYGFDTA